VAEATDAARDQVLAARAELALELQRLEASAREAVDIPAKIRRSPAKAAAAVGGIGFLALKGPQRVVGLGRRVVRGKSSPLPKSMLPDEIDKTLRSLGSDGDKVRGALERDFAAYAKQASRDRTSFRNLLLLTVARPILGRGAKAAAEFLFAQDQTSYTSRLDAIRKRTEDAASEARASAADAIAAARGEAPGGATDIVADRDAGTPPPV
jgi:hypothetical protein